MRQAESAVTTRFRPIQVSKSGSDHSALTNAYAYSIHPRNPQPGLGASRTRRFYFVPRYALSNTYFPDPTSSSTPSSACCAFETSARPANGFPPSLTSSNFALGNRTVAVLFAGTSRFTVNFPSRISQPDSTSPYMLSTDAFAFVKPPPGRGC